MRKILIFSLLVFIAFLTGCEMAAEPKIIDETKTVHEIKTQGVFTKVDQVVATYTLYIGQHQDWEDLDLSTYFTGQAVVNLHFEAISGCDNEYCNMGLKEKDSTYDPENVQVYRGIPVKTDYIEMVTNQDGVIEIKSDYGWPIAKNIVVEVTLRYFWN